MSSFLSWSKIVYPAVRKKLVTLTTRCAALGKYMQNACSVPGAVSVNFFITWLKLGGLFSVYETTPVAIND
jgi:hypothetical protein